MIRKRRCQEVVAGYDRIRDQVRRCGKPAVLWIVGSGHPVPLCADHAHARLRRPRGRWGIGKTCRLMTDAERFVDAVDLMADEAELAMFALGRLPDVRARSAPR
jgi:hypothetical protein